ncbi:hypothetical protein BZA70DRAFT_284547 [Myxozyma melibiosi]|uniref:HIT-type domain-containing protein n=1 Tax=Myxozyma melibiosi TaxID=54550 RepID=A0ABR1EZI8_9ASCO
MSSPLTTLNRDIQDSLTSTFEPRICFFCTTSASKEGHQLGKYQCPRCSRFYCSLKCYRSKAHAACTASFKRDSTTASAAGVGSASGEGRRQVLVNDGVATSDEEKIRLRELVNEYALEAEEHPLGDLERLVNRPAEYVEDSEADSDDEHSTAPKNFNHSNNDDDDDDDDDDGEDDEARRKDLEDRMRGVDIESADFDTLWSRLTITEQADFLRLAQQHERESNNRLLE